MKRHPLAKRYARALFELADQRNLCEEILGQYIAFNNFLTQQGRVRAYLYSPQVEKKLKVQLLQRLIGGKVVDIFYHFILLVLRKGREKLFPEILEQFNLFYDLKAGRIRAQIISAIAIDAGRMKTIQALLSEHLHAEVICENEVDVELLGGMIVKVGGKVFDGSLRQQLQQLRKELLHGKYHTIRSEKQ